MTGVDAPPTVAILSRGEAEDFVHSEVALLDQGRHDEWLDLFADDGVYWVPSNTLDHDPGRHVSIIHDTKEALAKRIMRYQRGRLVQEIPSRTLHLVGNVTVEPPEPGSELVEVRAGLALFEVHAERNITYPAHCHYRLRQDSGRWRIVMKKVAFLANDQYFASLAFLF
ncbi:MAG TPA: aromatic-ring-hydroxylating dioxygenase subunit beta [Pseudonocardia sp.]|jgi:benzoate/toluate 1,2-dioxygenase beta subunit|nr:aromatic-ring-hydroxylating dioxygenase subunit beta [Pseudonocardia sp.]